MNEPANDTFGAESLHHEDHFALSFNDADEYRVRSTSCPWFLIGQRTDSGVRLARLAAMAHAVEFHNCTYKADPKNV